MDEKKVEIGRHAHVIPLEVIFELVKKELPDGVLPVNSDKGMIIYDRDEMIFNTGYIDS